MMIDNHGLSRDERVVLDFVAEGLTDRQIALRCGLGRSTVEAHVARVMSQLRVATRSGAVDRAYHLGLLALPAPPPLTDPQHRTSTEAARGIT